MSIFLTSHANQDRCFFVLHIPSAFEMDKITYQMVQARFLIEISKKIKTEVFQNVFTSVWLFDYVLLHVTDI